MDNIPAIAIDPYLLKIPNPCNSVEQFDHYVQGLLAWSSVSRRKDVCALLSEATKGAMITDNMYPQHHEIRSVYSQFNPDYISIKDLCDVSAGLVDKTPTLEEWSKVRALLYDEHEVTLTPDLFCTRLSANTQKSFVNDLLIFGISNQAVADLPQSILATRMEPKGLPVPADLNMKATVEEIECMPDSYFNNVPQPFPLCTDIDIYHDFNTLLSSIEPSRLWTEPLDNQKVNDSIEARIQYHLHTGTGNVAKKEKYFIGGAFVDSLMRWDAMNVPGLADTTIDSCARIILYLPREEIIIFRENDNPGSKQKVRRDGALAWRTQLTKRDAGFRLMFWELTNGTLEFANVGDKDELVIL
jgi:hypothetical protein